MERFSSKNIFKAGMIVSSVVAVVGAGIASANAEVRRVVVQTFHRFQGENESVSESPSKINEEQRVEEVISTKDEAVPPAKSVSTPDFTVTTESGEVIKPTAPQGKVKKGSTSVQWNSSQESATPSTQSDSQQVIVETHHSATSETRVEASSQTTVRETTTGSGSTSHSSLRVQSSTGNNQVKGNKEEPVSNVTGGVNIDINFNKKK